MPYPGGYKVILNTVYHTQRNNQLYPYSTCGTTILSEYLDFLGYNFSDDDVFKALNSQQMIDRANALIQKGDTYIKQLLNQGFRDDAHQFTYLNNSIIMLCETGKFLTNYKRDFALKYGTLEQLKACINEGFPVGIAGMFTKSGHYVLMVGYDDNAKCLIIDDPYGDWRKNYQSAEGKNVYYSLEKLIPILHKDGDKILYFRAY